MSFNYIAAIAQWSYFFFFPAPFLAGFLLVAAGFTIFSGCDFLLVATWVSSCSIFALMATSIP